MKTLIFLPIIIVFGMTFNMLEEGIKADNISQFKTLLLISFISFCLFYYCKWISARAAKTEGLVHPGFYTCVGQGRDCKQAEKDSILLYIILFWDHEHYQSQSRIV